METLEPEIPGSPAAMPLRTMEIDGYFLPADVPTAYQRQSPIERPQTPQEVWIRSATYSKRDEYTDVMPMVPTESIPLGDQTVTIPTQIIPVEISLYLGEKRRSQRPHRHRHLPCATVRTRGHVQLATTQCINHQ